MMVAVYPSVLYGEDWIQESICSVLPHVDLVYVVMMSRPWGGTDGVMYRGEWVPWPQRFDDALSMAAEVQGWTGSAVAADGAWKGSKIHILDGAYSPSPWDRWAFGVSLVRKQCDPEEVITLDPDCVFSEDEARKAFDDWDAHPEYQWAQPRQVELWKTPEWMVVRPRSMVAFHRGDLSLLSSEERSRRGVHAPQTHTLNGTVHNLGFAVSDRTMYWKHLTALAFSPVVGETGPNESWLDEKWLGWTPQTRNLEPAAGAEESIPCAIPYKGPPLPASVARRFK